MRRDVCALRIMHTRYRWMRPCRATRAGTQAPPLPASIKPLCRATFSCFSPSAEPLPAIISCICPSAEPLPAIISCVCPSASPSPAIISHVCPSASTSPAYFSCVCPSASTSPAYIPCVCPSANCSPPTFAHETRKVTPFMKGLQLFFVILQPIVSITRKR